MKEPFSRFFGLAEKQQVEQIKHIPVGLIKPSPYQPRAIFQDERLEELCQTIRLHGIIQPIVVRRRGKHYELIAGERRLRAVKKLNFVTIPAIIREMSDSQAAAASLIENLQREGLTSIEEARALEQLLEVHQLTQEGLAQRIGKSQSTIANKLRLLQSPSFIQEALLDRVITERHARALLSLRDEEKQQKCLTEIVEKELNVKQTEERVRKLLEVKPVVQKSARRYSRDFRIAVNTIRQSVDMIKQTGMNVIASEEESDQFFELLIKIPKGR
jgi:ParB family transcriptional regulator, chromosome partitioning protein